VYKSYSFLPKPFLSTQLRTGLSCSLIDNFVHVPLLYTPAFYALTGLMQGRTMAEATETFNQGYLTSLTSCWMMWVPVQVRASTREKRVTGLKGARAKC
jgi:hypothetical protein